jgi:hypothetical protein
MKTQNGVEYTNVEYTNEEVEYINQMFPPGSYYWPFDEKKQCDHNWKLYEGFSESYDYCEKCGVKKCE